MQTRQTNHTTNILTTLVVGALLLVLLVLLLIALLPDIGDTIVDRAADLCHHTRLGRRAAHLPASQTPGRPAAPSVGQARASLPGPANTGGSLPIPQRG